MENVPTLHYLYISYDNNEVRKMKEINELVKKYTEAIHLQDKEKFYELWSVKEECTLISIATVFNGVSRIYQDFLINRIQKAYQEIYLISDHIQINQVNEKMAIVTFSYHTKCLLKETLEPFGIEGIETQVMIKEEGQWKLVHIHYSKTS